MLDFFRQAKKLYTVMIAMMLLLTVQQSFAQNLGEFMAPKASVVTYMDMEHCEIFAMTQESEQLENCCDDNVCDSTHCYSAASVVALFPNHELINAYESQQYMMTFEQREINLLHSELFRPPRVS